MNKKTGSLIALTVTLLFVLTACIAFEKIGGEDGLYRVNDFTIGGLSVSDGTGDETKNTSRMRTGFWPINQIRIQWDEDCALLYNVTYYDEEYDLIGSSGFQAESAEINKTNMDGAAFVRFLLKNADDTVVFDDSFSMPEECYILSSTTLKTIYDEPANEGVANVIARAKQCAEITYTTKALLPGQKGDVESDTELTGIMYSSTRKESLFVPNAVSFESYLTALNDPRSYIYTRISAVKNSKTYYGAVCSSFVSYCLNLPCIYTTHQIGILDDLVLVEDQSVQCIQLGDVLLREDAHVSIIVGIERDSHGKIISISEAEARPRTIRVSTYSRRGIQEEWLDKGYQIYRYALIEEVPPAPVDLAELELDLALCPRRGNKANWRFGETVEIDILDPAIYTSVQLLKDGKLLSEDELPDDLCMTYEDLSCGKYEVRLSDGEQYSDPVSFIVIDTEISVEDLGDGRAKIIFHSDDAEPKWFAWCYPNENESDNSITELDVDSDGDSIVVESSRHYMTVVRAYELTEQDIEQGYVITEYESGNWLYKVEFETEYGLVSSSFVGETIT